MCRGLAASGICEVPPHTHCLPNPCTFWAPQASPQPSRLASSGLGAG